MIPIIIILGIIVAVLMASRLLPGRSGVKNNTVKKISASEARKLLTSKNAVLIDVRNPGEYQEKHIPKSVSLPLDRLENEAKKHFPDPSAPIITYCQTGRRSAMAATVLNRLGYLQIYDLGGIINWPYETESGRGNGA